jgi:glycosyltransferase EpsF
MVKGKFGMSEPARVLHVVGGMARGGAETMIMNLYRHVDRSRLQFDFLCTRPDEQSYDREIRELGGRILRIDSPAEVGHWAYVQQMKRMIETRGAFRVVHAHTLFNTGLVAAVAKRAGVPIRVSHSHSTSDIANASFKGTVYHWVMRRLILHYATHLVTCGAEAGRYLFGDRVYDSGRVMLLRNGLDLSAYEGLDRAGIVTQYNREFEFEDSDVVLGNVAGFRELKNHPFLIKLMLALLEENPNYKMVLVGDGDTRTAIEVLVAEHGLQSKVRFTGIRADIPELMTYLDVFLLPSLYEGLPVTIIEAQAAGTACVLSETITKEVDLGLGLVDWADIADVQDWLKKIQIARQMPRPRWRIRKNNLCIHGYSSRDSISHLHRIYGLNSYD